ncbi:MAG TPA: TonB family protein [Terriglobales bacterium]|nr:TonB family protein [Terriglobales bacterium]
MKYNALLFCPDDKTARVVTQVLTELEFHVEPCNEPFAAVKKLMAEHFDAIVADCESEQNAALLFKSAHSSGSNQSSLAVAVVEGQSGVAKAFRIGANLVLTKPINVEQSKGTLRVARGLLRKTDAAKPVPAATAPPQSAPSTAAKVPSVPQMPAAKPASPFLPAQPPPSPIPAVSASLFEIEADSSPKPEPAEAAFLESMPDPKTPSAPAKEYPWQPISKPAAQPMATALRRAAEATGRSAVDAPVESKIVPTSTNASISRSSTSMSSGQAAAAAPAKIKAHEQEANTQTDAPAFASLGAPSGEPAFGGKKIILIAAVLVAVAAAGYIGWTKMQSQNGTPSAQRLAAPPQTAPVQPPTPAQNPPSASPAQDTATTAMLSQPASAPPIGQGPDITLSTTATRPPAAKKSPSIIAKNTMVRTPSDAGAPTPTVVKDEAPKPAPMVVKNEVSKPASPSPLQADSAQPPAPGSLSVASNANDQAISGIMSTTASLPQQAPQKLKISQGVSQGLLIKSVEPVYPALARQMRIQGSVELLASIGKDGSITGVKLISGDSVLSHAAIDAVKQWKYKPYYLDDQPVAIQTQITIKFKLP